MMRFLILVLGLFSAQTMAETLAPIADVHTHYKWSQAEVTSPEQAIAALDQHGVELAVVIGTPPELALKLEALDPGRIVPIYGPYNDARNWYNWFHDPTLVSAARQALASGQYAGIGELHLIGGFGPGVGNSAVIDALMELAAEFRRPILIHSEYSRVAPFQALCSRHPETPVLWAHAGAILPPDQVRQVLESCPAVSVELSARDPWRYVNNPISDDTTGRLLPEWQKLVMDYPARFLVGSDTVWPVEKLDGWDKEDTGWQELGRFLGFHRRWLAFLPAPERALVGRFNARKLFAVTPGEYQP